MAKSRKTTRKTNKAVRKSIYETQIRRSATGTTRKYVSPPKLSIGRTVVVGTAVTPEVRKIQSRLQSIIGPTITTPLSEKNRSDKTNLRRRCKDRPTRNEARGGSGGKQYIPWCKK